MIFMETFRKNEIGDGSIPEEGIFYLAWNSFKTNTAGGVPPMKKMIFILLWMLTLSAVSYAADAPIAAPSPAQQETAVARETAQPLSPVEQLEELKKLIPPDVILIYTWSNGALPYLGDSIRQLLAQNRIGSTLSGTLQENYYQLINRIYTPRSNETLNQYMLKCARDIGGYLMNIRVIYQDYKVMTEYELIDPGNHQIICSNALVHNYGWSLKSFSETAMIDSSLKKMTKDLVKQLKVKKPSLVRPK